MYRVIISASVSKCVDLKSPQAAERHASLALDRSQRKIKLNRLTSTARVSRKPRIDDTAATICSQLRRLRYPRSIDEAKAQSRIFYLRRDLLCFTFTGFLSLASAEPPAPTLKDKKNSNNSLSLSQPQP